MPQPLIDSRRRAFIRTIVNNNDNIIKNTLLFFDSLSDEEFNIMIENVLLNFNQGIQIILI